MKLGVVGGAGLLGSTIAFVIAQKNLVDEIAIIDIKENLAKAHEMDMGQAISELSDTRITQGGWDALGGCDIVVISASMPERKVSSRIEFLKDNLKIVREVAAQMARHCPEAAVVNATNPVDPFVFILQGLTGMPARQFVGFTRNDTLRLRWAIAKVLNVATKDVEAMVIGEHGESQVPLYSTVRIKGTRVDLDDSQKAEASSLIGHWFANYQALQSGRTSGWTSALGVAHLVEAMVRETGEVQPCSAILGGEYGLTGVSVGIPVTLCRRGIAKIVEIPLTREEMDGLAYAAKKMTDIVNTIEWRG